MASGLVNTWRPYGCDVTCTWGKRTVPIAVAFVFGGFLTFIWFYNSIYATVQYHQIRTGIGARLPYLSWQIMFAIEQWVKFFIFQFSLTKCSKGPIVSIIFLNHIRICQLSPELNCSDTFQIWTWYSIAKVCFDNGENYEINVTEQIGLVTPTPELYVKYRVSHMICTRLGCAPTFYIVIMIYFPGI